MKKTLSILLTIIQLLSLSACSDSLETAEVIEVNTAQNSETYVEGEDFQQNWNNWGSQYASLFTQGDGGCYYYDVHGTMLLHFYDYETDTSVPLCDQPNCGHDSKDCNAVLSYSPDYMQYYDGNIYLLGADPNSKDVTLHRISTDGSSHGIVGTVLNLGDTTFYRAVVHRGYVYCARYTGDPSERSAELYRLSLSADGEAERICTFDPCFGGSMFLTAYGNYVYIQLQHYEDDSGNGYNGDLYRYHIHTGEVEPVFENMRQDFVVDSGHVYYDSGTQVIAYNLKTGEEAVLLEMGYPVYITYDGDYLYCDNGCGLWIAETFSDEEIGDSRTITIIDTETRKVAGTVVWDTESSNDMLGAANSKLFVIENHCDYYSYDLSLNPAGEEVVWKTLN